MADDDRSIIPGRWFIKYKCTENPSHIWNSFVGNSGKKKRNGKKCRKDGASAKVLECRPLKKSDIPDDTRMHGIFTCPNPGCSEKEVVVSEEDHHKWHSANAWKNNTQNCKKCGQPVLTWVLHFLRPRRGSYDDKQHHTDKCEKCHKVGGDCRKYNSKRE